MPDQGSINSGADSSSNNPYDNVGPNSEIGGMHGASIDPKTPRRVAPPQKKSVDTNKKRNFPQNSNGDTNQTMPEIFETEKASSTTIPATRTIDLVPSSFFSEAERIVRTQMIADLGEAAIFKEIEEKGDAAVYLYFPLGPAGQPLYTEGVTYNMKYLADIQETSEQRIVKKTKIVEIKQVKVEVEDEMVERTEAVVNFADQFRNRGYR